MVRVVGTNDGVGVGACGGVRFGASDGAGHPWLGAGS